MNNIKQTAIQKKREWWDKNKEEINTKRREQRKQNGEKIRIQERKHREENREYIRARDYQYYLRNKEKKHKQHMELYYKNHEKYRVRANKCAKKYRETNKEIVINHYSKGKNCCELCEETNKDVLSIDHIDGGGRKHSKEINRNNLYVWLRKNNFPMGFRILCMNCQFKERIRNNQLKTGYTGKRFPLDK